MDRLVLAWAAGFFDGEGTVLIRRSGNGLYLRISVSQVNPEPIQRFHKLFGGHFSHQESKNPKWKSSWKWEQDCHRAYETLMFLMPFLTVKREVAELGIKFQAMKVRGKNKTEEERQKEQEIKHRISELNKRD